MRFQGFFLNFDFKNLRTLIAVLTTCCWNHRRRLFSLYDYMSSTGSRAGNLLLIFFMWLQIDSTLIENLLLTQQYVFLEKVNFFVSKFDLFKNTTEDISHLLKAYKLVFILQFHNILRAIWNCYRETLPLRSEIILHSLKLHLHNLQAIVFYSYKSGWFIILSA